MGVARCSACVVLSGGGCSEGRIRVEVFACTADVSCEGHVEGYRVRELRRREGR